MSRLGLAMYVFGILSYIGVLALLAGAVGGVW